MLGGTAPKPKLSRSQQRRKRKQRKDGCAEKSAAELEQDAAADAAQVAGAAPAAHDRVLEEEAAELHKLLYDELDENKFFGGGNESALGASPGAIAAEGPAEQLRVKRGSPRTRSARIVIHYNPYPLMQSLPPFSTPHSHPPDHSPNRRL